MRFCGNRGVLLALILPLICCANASTIPPSQYQSEHGHSYRVHTTDGTTWYVADFTADDSTLTVLRLRHLEEEHPVRSTPFSIPLADVQSIEKVGTSDKTPFILMGSLLVIGFILGFNAYN
jgi:hypothetical protein